MSERSGMTVTEAIDRIGDAVNDGPGWWPCISKGHPHGGHWAHVDSGGAWTGKKEPIADQDLPAVVLALVALDLHGEVKRIDPMLRERLRSGATPASQPRPLPSGITEEMVACWDGDDLWCWLHLLPEGTECRFEAGGADYTKRGHRGQIPVLVSVPQEPETEKVEWWKAQGRTLPDGRRVCCVKCDDCGPSVWGDQKHDEWSAPIDPFGMVEVLREGDR